MKEWQRILLWGIGMTILILILKVVSADAHENACWSHLSENSTGRIYGQERCDMGVYKMFRDKDQQTWQYLIYSDERWHVFTPGGNCEVSYRNLGCRSDIDEARD
jgi:hypothetical protein